VVSKTPSTRVRWRRAMDGLHREATR
jgi:hypothetical protein